MSSQTTSSNNNIEPPLPPDYDWSITFMAHLSPSGGMTADSKMLLGIYDVCPMYINSTAIKSITFEMEGTARDTFIANGLLETHPLMGEVNVSSGEQYLLQGTWELLEGSLYSTLVFEDPFLPVNGSTMYGSILNLYLDTTSNNNGDTIRVIFEEINDVAGILIDYWGFDSQQGSLGINAPVPTHWITIIVEDGDGDIPDDPDDPDDPKDDKKNNKGKGGGPGKPPPKK